MIAGNPRESERYGKVKKNENEEEVEGKEEVDVSKQDRFMAFGGDSGPTQLPLMWRFVA